MSDRVLNTPLGNTLREPETERSLETSETYNQIKHL